MGAEARRRLGAPLAVAALALGLLAACTTEPDDPAEAARDRVEARLEATFSRQQAQCMLEQLDDEQVAALDRSTDLEDPAVLEAYSNAAVACVAGLGG